jgi:hypothetical protein
MNTTEHQLIEKPATAADAPGRSGRLRVLPKAGKSQPPITLLLIKNQKTLMVQL